MSIYRLNVLGKEGRLIVLGSTETAACALELLHKALGEYPRAWITNEQDQDVSLAELLRDSEKEADTE